MSYDCIWVNYNISLTWNKAIGGMIPLTNHNSSEGEQWGRDQIYPDCMAKHLQEGHLVGPGKVSPVDAEIRPGWTCGFTSNSLNQWPFQWHQNGGLIWFNGTIMGYKDYNGINIYIYIIIYLVGG